MKPSYSAIAIGALVGSLIASIIAGPSPAFQMFASALSVVVMLMGVINAIEQRGSNGHKNN